ncbi:MAG: branched-chain amino acid ABC transporter substrate-binding protein, partial [Cyanobacteria bacterium P01_H01_bin.121]
LWGADVNWRTAMAYDAAVALAAGIEAEPTREGVAAALAASNFQVEGATSTVRFLPRTGDRNQPFQLVEVLPGSRSGTGYDFVLVD